MNEDRIIEQLDTMVESGRITEDEAARLRTAQGTPEMDLVMGGIRARHASPHIESAVRAGDMTEEEADHQLDRDEAGPHCPRRVRHGQPGQ